MKNIIKYGLLSTAQIGLNAHLPASIESENSEIISISSSANLGATPGSADTDNIIFNGGTLNTTGTFTLGSNKGITMTGNGTINTNSSTTLT